MAAMVATMLAASACTSDLSINEAVPATIGAPSTTTIMPATIAATTTTPTPRDRGPVRFVRANWDTGLVHSSLVMELLTQLGFEPVDVDINDGDEGHSPDQSYPAIASDDADLYANGWFPGHFSWFEVEDAGFTGTAGDHLTVVSTLVPAGGLQGWLITKAWADAEGIDSLDQIAENRSLALQLDRDGNGQGEIYGCPEDWTCDDIINSYLRLNTWENLEQLRQAPHWSDDSGQPSYDAMFDEFLTHVSRGEPAVAYTWSPTIQHARARVGEATMWLSVSNEAIDIGARDLYENSPYPQIVRADGTIGFTDLPPERCTQGPNGCQTGWYASDISIVGNRRWVNEHPEVVAILNAVKIDRWEASGLIAELEALGLTQWDEKVAASHTIARAWMEANPERVAAWLDAR